MAAAAPAAASDATPPEWVAELAAREGMSSPTAAQYWQSPVQPHGECTVIALLHEGPEARRSALLRGGPPVRSLLC